MEELQMKVWSMFIAALGACALSPAAVADTPAQPPMNDFDSAFYTCADGWAFQMSYDSETPKTATMTTNVDGKSYTLTRADSPAGGGVAFASGPTRFWTDGKAVRVEGLGQPVKDCKLKTG
jgi:membrane-bound inhibitor of C-type lysozyme